MDFDETKTVADLVKYLLTLPQDAIVIVGSYCESIGSTGYEVYPEELSQADIKYHWLNPDYLGKIAVNISF